MPPSLVLVRNEGDAKRAKGVVKDRAIVVVMRMLFHDIDGKKTVFSTNTRRLEEAIRSELRDAKYRFHVVDCGLAEMPAETLASFAKSESCREIIVFEEAFNRDMPYANNFAATLAVVSDVPVRVIRA